MRADLLYPEYYKDVIINYITPEGTIVSNIAWLAVNDELEPIWTLSSDDTTIIPDDWVECWRPL